MPRPTGWWLLAFALTVLLARSAQAQITTEPVAPLPDPSKFAKGLYVDAELGAVTFLGDAREALGVGTAFGARLGYDLFRWLAVQARTVGSSHRTDFDGRPQSGELLQVYQLLAELKISVPIGRLSLFGFGGGGLAYLSTNLLGTTRLTDPDTRATLAFGGGAGVDWHPLTRHFSFGVQGAFAKLQALRAPGGVAATTYLRYTF